MKYKVLLLLSFLIPFSSKADFGPCYIFKVMVEMNDKTTCRGFISSGWPYEISASMKEELKKDGGKFTSFIKDSIYAPESITVYQEAVSFTPFKNDDYIPEQTMLFVRSSKRELTVKEIKLIRLVEIYNCTVGMSPETLLRKEDRSWLKKVPVGQELFHEEICEYEILYYGRKDEEVKALASTFQESVRQGKTEEIKRLLEELRIRKVLVISYCSC